MATRLAVVAFALIAPLALTTPAMAEDDVGDQVVLTGRVTIASEESAGNVVVFHGPVRIEGEVRDSMVVFDGRVTISGTVGDDVVVFNGEATVSEGARIGGDLVTLRRANVSPGAEVEGDVRRIRDVNLRTPIVARFAVWLAFTVSTLVLGLLLLALARGGMETAAAAGRSRLGPAAGWGIVMLVGLPILGIALLVSLVAIPLGVAVLMGLFLLYTIGYTVGAFVLGRAIVKPPRRRLAAFFAGWGILRAIALVPILGGLAWALTTIGGLGSVTMAVWRARRATPPVPVAPAITAPPPPTAPAR
jgi:hypothetical protein